MNTSLFVEADTTAVTPGTAVPAPVRVRNTGDVPMQVLVRVAGVEDSWTGPPMMVGPLAPGEETTVEFLIRIPVGFPPCDHLAGIEAEPIDPSTGAPLGRAVFVEMVLEIGDGSQVAATLDPTDINGGGRGRFRVEMRNRGRSPIRVQLEGESPGDTLAVRFAEDEVVLPPGEYVRVKGSVRGSRPLIGPSRRLPFVVTIRSRGTPRHLDGSFTQSATLKSGVMKVFAVVALVGMWASLLVFGLGKINPPHKANSTNAAATQSGTASDGGSSDSGSGGATGGGDGGASGGSSGGGGGGGSTAAQAPTGTGEIRVGGKVKASDPSGATVSIQRTSLVDENAQGATFVNGSPSSALTMHYGHTGVSAPSLIAPPRTTTTDADGAWAFAGITSPGFYLIIISKPGFATKKYVVTAPEDGSPIVLDTDLVAGDGTLGGTITGPDGQGLGGVDLTITDGTVTLKTITPTTGDVGKWSVTGLTTPGHYLITAARRGFGTETLLVDLAAGDSKTDANIAMKAGVGSVSGHVFSQSVPVGGVNVTITDGNSDHSASTLTIGDVGFYALPQLPLLPPGQFYTLTVTGQGWTTSTQQVDLNDGNDNPTVDVNLTPANGSLSGIVEDDLACTTGPPCTPNGHHALAGVGITISNENITLKTTSASDTSGLYVQTEVPPGTYKVTFEKFGFITQSAVVSVVSGAPSTQDIAMPTAPVESLILTGTVSITVVDQKCGTTLSSNPSTTTSSTTTTTTTLVSSSAAPSTTCTAPLPSPFNVTVSYVDEQGTPHSSNDAPTGGGDPPLVVNGVALFHDVTPGLHTFHVTADHHKPADVVVQVFPNLASSGTAVLLQNAIVTGQLTDVGAHPILDTGMDVKAIPPPTSTGLSEVHATIAPDGRYTFDGTLEEGTWTLVASGSDFVTNDGQGGHPPPVPVTVFAAQTIEQPITLHRKGRIQAVVKFLNSTGSVVDLTGAVVHVTGPTNPADETVGPDDLQFSGLTAGTYTVTVTNGTESRTLPAAIVVDDGTTTASVTYGGLVVSINNVNEAGSVVGGPATSVSISGGPSSRVAQSVAAGDKAFFPALKPGTYTVTVANGSETRNLSASVVNDGANTQASVTYGSLEVKVLTVDGGANPIDGPATHVSITGPSSGRAAQDVASGGAAFFPALLPGTYSVTVTQATGATTTFSQTFNATVTDGNVTRAQRVLGRLEVAVQAPNVSGALTNSGGATVTLKRGGVTQATVTSSSDGPTVFTGLDATSYTVEVSGTTEVLSPTITNGAVTRVGLVLASSPTHHLTGHVIWNVNGTTNNVPSAVISVQGITSYTFTTLPVAPFFSFTVNTGTVSGTFDANGLFDVDTTGFKFLTGNITVSASNFVTRPVGGGVDAQLTNADLDGPIAAAPCPSNITSSDTNAATFANACIVLSANPGTLNGTITLVGAHGDTPNAVVTAQITQPLATGITVTVASDGHLVVTDPTVGGTNAIRPGNFQITFTATGYDTSPVGAQSFTINPNQPTTVDATLTKRASLPINVFCRNASPAGPTEPTATVHLTGGPTSSFDQTLTGRSPITFTNLLAGTYNADVTAPGCAESDTNSFTLAAGDSDAQPVSLTKLARVTGRVLSKLTEASTGTSGVNGLTVTLTGQNHGQVASAQTQPDGSFSLGDTVGLIDDTYTLAIDPFPTDAYTLSTSNTPIPNVTITGHVDVLTCSIIPIPSPCTPDVLLIAKKATMHGTIRSGSSSGPALSGVVVTATTSQVPPSGKTLTATTGADGQFFFDDGSGTNHAASLEPVLWSFNYTLTDFQPLGEQITLAPGSTLVHDVVLAEQTNTIGGTTFTRFGTANAVAENGVTVSIAKNGGSSSIPSVVSATDANSNVGRYSFSGLKNGSYTLTFHKAGFTDKTDQLTVHGSENITQDETISVNAVATTVTVTSAVTDGGDTIFVGGSTVTLTPKVSPAQRSHDTYTAVTNSSGVANFNATVLPSTYTITISAATTSGLPDLTHLTTLNVSEMTINVNDASASQSVVVQEARVFGKVFIQDTGSVPTSGTLGLTVKMYIGTDTSGAADDTFTTVTDTTLNAIAINWAAYVPPSASGYTFVFGNGANYNAPKVFVSNPFAAPFKTVNVGSVFVKHLTTLTITLTDKNGATPTAAAVVEILDDANPSITYASQTGVTTGTYTFPGLDPNITYRIRATQNDADTITTVSSTTLVVHHVEGKVVTNVHLTPGTATRSIQMTEPQSAIDEP